MRAKLGDIDDGALARLAGTGDDHAYAEIVRRHRSPVYRLIVASIADPDEALDLVQETFVAAHRAMRRFDPERSMRAWLSAIALNKCRDWERRRRVRRFLTFARPIDDDAAAVPSDAPGSDAIAENRQQLALLRQAIARLPAPLREPLVLHLIEGLSQADTASILSITPKAVETRLRRARLRLSEQRDAER